ncbi:MAG: ornithine cyclodeaminase family protein [Betaproteobacteria bacterium]|nr:ornithine cyclodeaminase family protein [Betaproteobacteria bacterium]
MTLILNNTEVAKAVTMAECVDAIEDAFKEVGRGWAMSDPRIDRHMPTSKEAIAQELGIPVDQLEHKILNERIAKDAYVEPEAFGAPLIYMFKTMFGAIHKTGIAAVRTSSEVMSMPVVNGKLRYCKIPTGPGGRYTSLIQLFSARTGQLLCIMPDGYIQRNRVVATGAVGTKHLARQNAKRVGILGSGMMAGGSIEATLVVRPGIEHIKVFSPNAKHREAFVQHWRERTGVDIVAVESAEAAVREVDIAIGATNTFTPVLRGEWIAPGTHINSTTPGETDEACHRRADVRVMTWWSHGDHFDVDDYVLPAAPEAHAKVFSEGRKESSPSWMPNSPQWPTAELGDLLVGKATGRTSPKQITFHMNGSAGVQFAALGGKILENARNKGLGHEVPTDWFLEELHP